MPIPQRDFTSPPRLIIIRSFDVNKPGEEVRNLKGGVVGGSILQGVLRLGDEIEIRPGHVKRDADGNIRCSPILSKILTLKAEENALQYAVPGGLIGVGLRVDPTLTRADKLVGQVLGVKGSLPGIFLEIDITYFLLRRLLGVKVVEGEKGAKVSGWWAAALPVCLPCVCVCARARAHGCGRVMTKRISQLTLIWSNKPKLRSIIPDGV